MKTRKLKFEKDPDGRWYVVLPEWTGDRAALEMVSGADTLLDILSSGYDTVKLFVDTHSFDDAKSLNLLESSDHSGTYSYKDGDLDMTVWLCPVTEFVFGEIPERIYFRPC